MTETRGGAELVGEPGLRVAVHENGVHAFEELLHQLAVAEVGLVRQHVVGDHHRARAGAARAALGRAATDAGGAQQREVGGHDGGDDVDDDDDVEAAQPPPGAHPGVGTGPAQRADGARERLDVGRAPGHGLLTRVELRGVEVRPRHQRDVVAGLGQLVGQARRVGGDPALVGVGGADDRDLEGCAGVTAPGPRAARGHEPATGIPVVLTRRSATARRGRTAAPASRS